MTELKPCPFCGGEAELGFSIAFCKKCGAQTDFYNNTSEIIRAWNKRSNWHTGTPAEDGKYLVLWKDIDTGQEEYSMLMWHSMINSWYDLEMGELWHDEYHAEVIAWQKIEPYKETD